MNGNGFTRSRRPSRHSAVGSCNCSILVTRLSIICFLFLCVVLLLQVYEHRKRESQFHHRSIREYVQIGVKVSRTSSLNNTLMKDMKLKGRGKARQHYLRAPPPPEMNATHINGILMEPVDAKYARNIYFTVKTTHKYYTERLFPLMSTWLQVVDKNKVSWYS